MQNSDFLFEESCSSSVFDVEGEADESLTPKRIHLSEASNVMWSGKYRFDKVPTSAESFAKGLYAGNIKPDDLTEFSFDRYDGNLLVGKWDGCSRLFVGIPSRINQRFSKRFELLPLCSVEGAWKPSSSWKQCSLTKLGAQQQLSTFEFRLSETVCWLLGISAKSLKPKTKWSLHLLGQLKVAHATKPWMVFFLSLLQNHCFLA